VNEDRFIGEPQFIESHFRPMAAAHALAIDREAGFPAARAFPIVLVGSPRNMAEEYGLAERTAYRRASAKRRSIPART
jgi:hypothetical protein